MNWDAMGAVAELFGAVGVVASLVYLARQMRGNTAQSRRTSAQAVLARLNEVETAVSTDPQIASLWVRGSAGMSRLESQEEANQFAVLIHRYFRAYEELVEYRRDGWVDDWAWESFQMEFKRNAEAPGVLE